MTDYIEREALQKLFNDVSTSLLSRGELAKDAEHMVRAFLMVTEMIQDAPAADVAEVVRCPACRHYRIRSGSGDHFCIRLEMDLPNDSEFFCKYGKDWRANNG